MKKKEIDMLNGPVAVPIIRFALPIVLMGLLQVLYNSADIIVVGQFAPPGSTAVAAIGSTTALIHLVTTSFINMSVGTNVALAMAIGRDDKKAAHEVVHTSLLLAFIIGIILLLVGVLFSRDLLIMTGSLDDVIDGATLYMQIYFIGMPGALVYNFGSAVLKSKGDTKRPLYVLIVAGIANILFNMFFVAVLGMEEDGVAWATNISQYLSAIAIVWFLLKEKDCCKLELKKLRFYADKVRLILKYGVPAGLSSIMFNISNVFLQTSLNSFNITDILTGNAAANSLDSLTCQSINGFGQAALTFAGQNAGAGNEKRIYKILKTDLLLNVGFAMVIGVILYSLGPQLIRLYSPQASEDVIRYGMMRITVTQLFYWTYAANEAEMDTLRGMGYSTSPTIVLVVSICVFRIIWIFTAFPVWHDVTGLFACYPISWTLSTLIMTALLFFIKRRRAKGII